MIVRSAALALLSLAPPRHPLVRQEQPADKLFELESDLAAAIRGEQYERAAALRDELNSLRMDGELSVLSANEAFYRAFRKSDFKAMTDVWSKSPNVVCAHPGNLQVRGADVMSSWRVIFSGGAPDNIEARDVKCTLLSSTAAQVTCIEQVGPGQLTCTNIFVLEEDGWKMLNHHAAPVMAAGPPQLPSD